MTAPRIVLPGSQWQVHDDEVDGLVDRLSAAAAAGDTLTVRILDDAGGEGALLVAPASVPVVVTGVQRPAPVEGFPQHLDDKLPI